MAQNFSSFCFWSWIQMISRASTKTGLYKGHGAYKLHPRFSTPNSRDREASVSGLLVEYLAGWLRWGERRDQEKQPALSLSPIPKYALINLQWLSTANFYRIHSFVSYSVFYSFTPSLWPHLDAPSPTLPFLQPQGTCPVSWLFKPCTFCSLSCGSSSLPFLPEQFQYICQGPALWTHPFMAPLLFVPFSIFTLHWKYLFI